MKHKDDDDTNCNWYTQNNSQKIGKGTGRFRSQRRSGDYNIIKIGQNTEKSPGDLRTLGITQ